MALKQLTHTARNKTKNIRRQRFIIVENEITALLVNTLLIGFEIKNQPVRVPAQTAVAAAQELGADVPFSLMLIDLLTQLLLLHQKLLSGTGGCHLLNRYGVQRQLIRRSEVVGTLCRGGLLCAPGTSSRCSCSTAST